MLFRLISMWSLLFRKYCYNNSFIWTFPVGRNTHKYFTILFISVTLHSNFGCKVREFCWLLQWVCFLLGSLLRDRWAFWAFPHPEAEKWMPNDLLQVLDALQHGLSVSFRQEASGHCPYHSNCRQNNVHHQRRFDSLQTNMKEIFIQQVLRILA